MRIQHNIMAMNAYRNYNTNTSALSKNLEKLSSGYKINRAGDDAAGLAISEKMRAQITGLNAAQKNVKDGISLVKTAEGAMQEIQDMLNRMDYLATQSANGTYQDEVDRENLQKEVSALKTEINRIADSANFNGIKLLDGSLQEGATNKTDALKAAEDAQKAADEALAAADSATGEIVFGEEETLDLATKATNNTPSTNGADETIFETDYKDSGKPGFSVALNGIEHTFKDPTDTADTTAGTDYVSIKVADGSDKVEIKLTEKAIADAYKEVNGVEAKKGDTASAEVIAKAIENIVKNTGVGGTPTKGEFQIKANEVYTVKADGDRVVFEAKKANDKVPHYNVEFQGKTQVDEDAKGAVFTTGKYTAGTAGQNDNKATIAAKINGKSVSFETANNLASDSAASAWATAIGNATATIDGKTVKLSDYFTVATADLKGGTSDPAFTFEDKTAGAVGSGNTIETVTLSGTDAGTMATGISKTDGYDAFKSGTSGYTNSGTPVTIQSGTPAIDQLASTVITLDATQVVDGAALRLGEQTYVFSIGEDSEYKNAENVVRVDDLADSDLDADGKLTATGLEKVLDKLAEVAKNNTTFSVSHKDTAGHIGLKQLAEVKDTTDMSDEDKFKSYIGLTTVDSEKTAANTAAAVEAAKADAAKLQEVADKLKAKAETAIDGKPLTLQIGDTSDDFNQMKVSVGDMHTAAMKGKDGTAIADIDISNQEGASAAVQTIKDAINYVSSVRGDLGATQNRLEHTANNLSVMAENITDAESTIRDTDVAEEMMAYTKNNILIQSAQAMLAQANAVPQGVLQLLG